MKFRFFPLLVIVVAGCATTPQDYNLIWDARSARLHVLAADGKELLPFSGELIGIPGYLFTRDGVKLHPGTKSISYSCPRSDGIELLDVVPGVQFTFKPGKEYDLRCVNGVPAITIHK